MCKESTLSRLHTPQQDVRREGLCDASNVIQISARPTTCPPTPPPTNQPPTSRRTQAQNRSQHTGTTKRRRERKPCYGHARMHGPELFTVSGRHIRHGGDTGYGYDSSYATRAAFNAHGCAFKADCPPSSHAALSYWHWNTNLPLED
jgi:hypothetical protein